MSPNLKMALGRIRALQQRAHQVEALVASKSDVPRSLLFDDKEMLALEQHICQIAAQLGVAVDEATWRPFWTAAYHDWDRNQGPIHFWSAVNRNLQNTEDFLRSLTDGSERKQRHRKVPSTITPKQPIGGQKPMTEHQRHAGRIFIGHGHSYAWRDLKDFLSERLGLRWDEFNREPTAGLAVKDRLNTMLEEASFAFLLMTAEDERSDGTKQARANVVHEVGLFQGRLGFERAIVLLEDGCEEFSNIIGLTQIRFPRGNIRAVFEDIRRVLEREGVLTR